MIQPQELNAILRRILETNVIKNIDIQDEVIIAVAKASKEPFQFFQRNLEGLLEKTLEMEAQIETL